MDHGKFGPAWPWRRWWPGPVGNGRLWRQRPTGLLRRKRWRWRQVPFKAGMRRPDRQTDAENRCYLRQKKEDQEFPEQATERQIGHGGQLSQGNYSVNNW